MRSTVRFGEAKRKHDSYRAAMPEGHTIHRLARDLRRDLAKRAVRASSPQGRFAAEAERIDTSQLAKATAWGKHLFMEFDGGGADDEVLHIHLGLIGKFRPKPSPPPEPVGEIRLRLSSDKATWDLSGPTVCEMIDPGRYDEITAGLGPDPLRQGAKQSRAGLTEFQRRLGRKRIPIGAALLDQKVIAGIGNVYRAEFCFLEGIHPNRPANQLTDEEAERLWKLTVDQLKRGVRLNRIVTRDETEAGAKAGRIGPGDRLYAYKRMGQPCRRCTTPIERIMVANRKMWFCPTCQPN